MKKTTKTKQQLWKSLKVCQKSAIQKGLGSEILKKYYHVINFNQRNEYKEDNKKLVIIVTAVSILTLICVSNARAILGTRCLLPSNYLVWEATRPLADCVYCENVTKPIILRNISQQDFKVHAYSPKPIIVKNAVRYWPAVKVFNFNFFQRLYDETDGSYESLEEGCQFLNFKTDLFNLREVFRMPEARVRNEPGQKPWYVGWGNCHPHILEKVRPYYSIPEFLPEDAEFPSTENIFFGYEMGAVMHLDYISRLMWQGQVSGDKIWSIIPVPECEHICKGFKYYVEQGDVVLLDTRLWYHATRIPKGQFSMTVQSEYG